MSVNKYAGASMDDIVFEGRNKQYGAYELRKINPKFMAISTAIAVAAYVAFILLSQLNITLGSKEAKEEVIVESTEVDLPKEDINIPDAPPPPPPPPPPQAPQIKFVEMVVKKDELVADEKVATQEELKDDNKQISNQDKEGDPNAKSKIVEPERPQYGSGPVVPVAKEDKPDDNEVFTIVEKMPDFPGGPEALRNYLNKVKYPDIAVENNVQGTVIVSFVVEKDGSVSDVKVVKGADLPGGLPEAAIKHIQKMPKWTPGRQRDNPTRVRMTAPIKFKIQ